VYKGFSKNVGLDEANQTKRIILPEPFVRFIRQRLFRKRKAPVDLSEHLISPLNRQVLPLTPPFFKVKKVHIWVGIGSGAKHQR
ncbi:MAG: hypothetical protein IKY84_01570, partial [Bacteroidaceae bacterium]|nr:hypothetical protein [Bacteroidaceae bacterium]